MPFKHYRIEDTFAGRPRGGFEVPRCEDVDAQVPAQSKAFSSDTTGAAAGLAGMRPDRHGDIVALERELLAMRDAIATTKREVASFQRSHVGQQGMHRAASELDAVSCATERATSAILGAIEEIESAANLLKVAQGGDPRGGAIAETIIDRVLTMYEACNFQDIAGQRIKKVVATLKFVEGGLDRVIAAWGEVMPHQDRSAGALIGVDPRNLVHGPALPGDPEAVTQAEIDVLFT